MALNGSRRWTRQPPSGFADINPQLPQPWGVFRTLGDRQQAFPAPALSTTYSGNASRGNGGELGVYVTGGGIEHTFVAQPDRQIYAVAVRFQQLATASTQTIFGINGNDNGTQVRINTSEQLELLAQASALLATSSSAPFGKTTQIRTLVAVCPATSGSTYFYLDGALVLTYAGVVDNKNLNKLFTLGKRGGTGEALTGVIYDAVFWSGAGNLPTLAQAQAISQDYYGEVYAPIRRRKFFLKTGAGAYTLTAATGSFAFTGYAAGLKTARNLTAAVGDFTLTGYAAGLNAGRKIAAAEGQFTLTGVAAALSAARRLTCVTGDFALTGYDATLTYTPASGAYTLTAEAGDFALTGYAADLIPSNRGRMVGGGTGKAKRVRKRYQVEIDGESFDVESPEEAKQVLETLRQAAEDKAAEAIQAAANTKRQNPRKVIRDARKALTLPDIAAPQQFAGLADSVLEQVRQTYEDAMRTIEIAALLRQREIEDDDEEVMLLL